MHGPVVTLRFRVLGPGNALHSRRAGSQAPALSCKISEVTRSTRKKCFRTGYEILKKKTVKGRKTSLHKEPKDVRNSLNSTS
ncbi:hypothetical protein NPIL_124311 [Nephila pilipes]|uniref:Uncharacterized protein n=1 Tax=Nephila pilipes TaxID=299642 RepID=A0A8X6TJC6_NEPPI|nr:hypothetical protein NPIL_124311 [Nephila pilipes]